MDNVQHANERNVNQHGVNLDDVKIGSTVTVKVAGVVKSNPNPSQHEGLGKFVNVQSEGGTGYRIVYLSEVTSVTPPPVKAPESGLVVVGDEVFNLLPDAESWESLGHFFYKWDELVSYARANGFKIFELEVGKQVQL